MSETESTPQQQPQPAEGGQAAPTREWLAQLQAMIENLATQAAPVAREIVAKAAELAALASEKAGPIATRAAEVTVDAGTRFAERSRTLATELRREPEGGHAAAKPAETAGGAVPAAATEASPPAPESAAPAPEAAAPAADELAGGPAA